MMCEFDQVLLKSTPPPSLPLYIMILPNTSPYFTKIPQMPFPFVSAWNKRRRSKSQDHGDPWVYKALELWEVEGKHQPSPPAAAAANGSTVFTLREMEEATGWFREENLIGKGGFGKVYKGRLATGEVVAIKKMEVPPLKAAEGEREFRVEVDVLSRMNHRNLVALRGYCADGKQRFLVYDYMRNGNLQDHLNGVGEGNMDWPSRLKVALGAAQGLAYLHSSSDVGIPIIHRDFKSSNVLLDNNFEAKISDFGLAKFMPEGQDAYVTAMVLGTFGYLDPEYASTGKLTLQSDVYAFGVVLLELLTGRRAVDLNQGPTDHNIILQARNALNDRKKLRRVIDPRLPRSSYTIESTSMFASLASRCVKVDSSERPNVRECVRELQQILLVNSRGVAMALHTLRKI